MSASPIARQATQSQSIPSKRIVIHDPNQLPADYSSTPGGTLYSTTPGGQCIRLLFLSRLKPCVHDARNRSEISIQEVLANKIVFLQVKVKKNLFLNKLLSNHMFTYVCKISAKKHWEVSQNKRARFHNRQVKLNKSL